jgi:hypothetical protein
LSLSASGCSKKIDFQGIHRLVKKNIFPIWNHSTQILPLSMRGPYEQTVYSIVNGGTSGPTFLSANKSTLDGAAFWFIKVLLSNS